MIYDVVPGTFKNLAQIAQTKQNSFESNIEKYRNLLDKETITLKTATDVPFILKNSLYGISTQTEHSFSIDKLIQINDGILKSNPDGTYGQLIVKDINNKFPNCDVNQNHILIIDEVNRGNISKIFGELITLIEPSKRIGEEEEIRVKLPHSGESFGVPPNLYIIGTMNTADRSIAQIDTALRRRFVFQEMMPRPELLKDIIIKDTSINIEKILEAINERIEYIYDREHTIGHSYFLPLINNPTKDRLEDIFRVSIIPLLAEYFYGDWSDIAFILNNDFIQEKKTKKYIKEDSSRQLNRVYKINDKFETPQYLKIYNGVEE
jgi:5-methylcytosine-specific restriction protein B